MYGIFIPLPPPERKKKIMSDYSELKNVLDIIPSVCTIPYPNSTVTNFFLIFNFWPIALGFIFFGWSVVKCNYPFLLLTITNFIDTGLNYLLQEVIDERNNIQPEACPFNDKQMPALAGQRVAVLYTVMWFLATFTYPQKMGKSNVLWWDAWTALALYSRMYLWFSTPLQMLIGALFGIVEGVCLSFFFYFLMVHGYDFVIIEKLSHWYIHISDDFVIHPTGEPDITRTTVIGFKKGLPVHATQKPLV